MHRNIESLCCVPGTNSVTGQLYFKTKLTEKKKRSDLWFPGGWWEGELDEGSQKVTRPVISKY